MPARSLPCRGRARGGLAAAACAAGCGGGPLGRAASVGCRRAWPRGGSRCRRQVCAARGPRPASRQEQARAACAPADHATPPPGRRARAARILGRVRAATERRARRRARRCSAQWTEGKASSSHGISSQAKRRTSRLSGPGLEARLGQAGAEDDLHLADPGDGIDREHAIEGDARAGFLPGFAAGAFLDRLAHFHVAGGDGPEAAARFDGAAAEQDRAVHGDDAADDDLRVLIGDDAAIGAGQPLAVVALGDAADEVGTWREMHAGRRTRRRKRLLARCGRMLSPCARGRRPRPAGQTRRSSSEPRGRAAGPAAARGRHGSSVRCWRPARRCGRRRPGGPVAARPAGCRRCG